jgi:hypothetical protein
MPKAQQSQRPNGSGHSIALKRNQVCNDLKPSRRVAYRPPGMPSGISLYFSLPFAADLRSVEEEN